jgi:hypothetical protein
VPKHKDMKAYNSTHYMEMRNQLHAPAGLSHILSGQENWAQNRSGQGSE